MMTEEEQSRDDEEKKKNKEQVWSWRDIRDEIASSFIFELALNLLLWIPRAIIRLFKNW